MMSPISASHLLRRSAFTLLEVLTTLALLVVIMGLMVSLARYVRAQSAQQYTRHLLDELDQAQHLYGGTLRNIMDTGDFAAARFSPSSGENDIDDYVQHSSGPYVAALLSRLHPTEVQTAVRDAWGNPVGYLPSQDPRIGMAPQNLPFFFSAGPDGRFLSRQDNLYSYEQIKPGDLPDMPLPMSGMATDSTSPDSSTRPAEPLDTANNIPITPAHPAAPGRGGSGSGP